MLKLFLKPITFLKKYRVCKRGATAVEFALIATPFLMLIFGVIEGGRMFWTINAVQYAVEETSRYASINQNLSDNDYQDYAIAILNDLMVDTQPLTITSSIITSNDMSFIVVSGNYTHETVVENILPEGFGSHTFDVDVRKPLFIQ